MSAQPYKRRKSGHAGKSEFARGAGARQEIASAPDYTVNRQIDEKYGAMRIAGASYSILLP
jgi:hypothetical protein